MFIFTRVSRKCGLQILLGIGLFSVAVFLPESGNAQEVATTQNDTASEEGDIVFATVNGPTEVFKSFQQMSVTKDGLRGQKLADEDDRYIIVADDENTSLNAPDVAIQYAATAVMMCNLEYQAAVLRNRNAVGSVSEPSMLHLKKALNDATTQLSETLDGQSPFPEANQLELRHSVACLKVEAADFQGVVRVNNRQPGSVPELTMKARKLRIQLLALRVKALHSQLQLPIP